MIIFYLQLEQAVEKELAWFRATTQGLEKLKIINLNPDVISSQLYEQKVSFSYKYFYSFYKYELHFLTEMLC